MSDTIVEATPLTREEIQTRWTQDLSLIFSTLETMAIERDWCSEWSRLVRTCNSVITVKLPMRELKYRASASIPQDSWCISDLREYARSRMDQSAFEDVVDVETKPVILPASLSNEELLQVWEQDIQMINNVLKQGAIDNSKTDDWSECVSEVNAALRFRLEAVLEREVDYTVTYTYRGTIIVPIEENVYDYVVSNMDHDMSDLEIDDVSWEYQ